MADYMTDYTKKPRSAAQYSMMRGVTDFTNAEQFNMYESGHSILVIINRPKFIEKIAEMDEDVSNLLEQFCNILEYEFKGLTGIEDISVDTLEFTDGISTMNAAGKANKQSASEVTMSFTEKSGSTITKFIKYYIDGVRDPRTQTRTYHGLIAKGLLADGFENEVFNFLYLVTDSTGLSLEAAYLLANAWPNNARTSIYESAKDTIESKQIDVTFQCFVVDGEEIDKRAVKMLAFVNEDNAVANATSVQGLTKASALAKGITQYDTHQINLQSPKYKYTGITNISKAYGETETIEEQQ